jgi:hypothetical protein
LKAVIPVAPVKATVGAPSKYSLKMAEEICDLIATGKSMVAIGEMEEMPPRHTILGWLRVHEEFQNMYARAKDDAADFYAEEIIKISNTPVEGVKTKSGPNGTEVTTGDMIDHRRLQVDARKWYAAKLAPRKYSEKYIAEHSGPDGGPMQFQPVINLFGKPERKGDE